MKFRFFKTTELEKPIRLSVHKSGNLGFSKEAEAKLKLSENKGVGIGQNADDENDESLYIFVHKEILPGEFKISKAGSYYYLNAKLLFDKLNINYKDGSVSFDMTKMEEAGEVYYRLQRVLKEKKIDDKEGKKE